MHRLLLIRALCCVHLAYAGCVLAQGAVTAASVAASAGSSPSKSSTTELAPVQISGARARLDAARNTLSPDTGTTIYRFSESDVRNLPLGESTPMNQVLLH